MRYEFIEAHQHLYPVAWLCEFLDVSRSGYYTYLKHQPSKREQAATELVKIIKAIHQQSRQRYGSPRIHAELQHRGEKGSLLSISCTMLLSRVSFP